MVKLLCRLYDPDLGQILFDEIDIRKFSQKDLRRMTTVMFQKPVQYYCSARENIGMSNMQVSLDHKAIEDAARSAGAHEVITNLSEGYDTPLGKWLLLGQNSVAESGNVLR